MVDNTPQLAYCYDPISAEHTLDGHPEHAGRIDAILDELEQAQLLALLQRIDSRPAEDHELLLCHSQQHIDSVKAHSLALSPPMGDVYYTKSTEAAARSAVGGLIDLCAAVLKPSAGDTHSTSTPSAPTAGLAFSRPPGHHAEPSEAMGFCFYASVAIAARHILQQGWAKRVAIFDFDVHFGNGTAACLESSCPEHAENALFISTHQEGIYPLSGSIAQATAHSEAPQRQVYCPLPAGVADLGYSRVLAEVVFPCIRRFKPDFLLISAGYDAHHLDPLAGLAFSCRGYGHISAQLVQLAQELCGGKIVFALEGGYHLQALAHGVANSVRALLRRNDFSDPFGESSALAPDIGDRLQEMKCAYRL